MENENSLPDSPGEDTGLGRGDTGDAGERAGLVGARRAMRPLTRATLVLFCSAVALVLARYLVLPCLPDTLVIVQELAYDLTGAKPDGSQWPGFFQRQKVGLEELCRQEQPRLSKYLTIKAGLPGRVILTARFNSAGPADGPLQDVRGLIATYLERYRLRCSLRQAKPETLPPDFSGQALRQWLGQQQGELTILQNRFIALLDEYSKLTVSFIGMEHRLGIGERAVAQEGSDTEFEQYARPALDKAVAEDAELIRLSERINPMEVELMLLENKASRDNGQTAGREPLDRRILELQLARNERLKEQAARRQTLLSDTRQSLWNEYSIDLHNRAESAMKQIKANTHQRELLSATLDQTRKRMEFVQSFLPPGNQAAQPEEKPVALLDDEFLPPLVTQPDLAVSSTFSLFQILTLFSSLLVGAALGFLVGPHHLATATAGEIETDDDSPADDPVIETASGNTGPASLIQPPRPAGQPSTTPTLYETLAGQLDHLIRHGSPGQPVLAALTAQSAQEASPRVAVNIGIALARRKIRVLLIELDRERSLSAVILAGGSPGNDGIYDWLAGQTPELPVYATPLKELLFIPVGQIEQALPDQNWAELKKIDRNQIDCILLYAPDGLPKNQPALASLCDYTIGMTTGDSMTPYHPAPSAAPFLGSIDWRANRWQSNA